MFQTPVVLIIFNRPDHTKKIFEIIRKIKPFKLFIIADGPRLNFPEDKKRCLNARNIVADIDWPCEIFKNYEDVNIGPKKKISTGLNWVFQHVDQAIILEDDCLADRNFFYYCQELLNYYANNDKIWLITGNNFQNNNWRGEGSYYFSKYPHTWGWATWKRSWIHYTDDIPFWNSWKVSNTWKKFIPDEVERNFWEKIFDQVYLGSDTYAFDYAWVANIWYHKGLTITPNVNLVSNIGHDAQASSTKAISHLANIKITELPEILIHPKIIKLDEEADIYDFNHNFGGKKLRFRRLIMFFFKLLKDLFKNSKL